MDGHLALGTACESSGQFEQAVSAYRRAVELAPNNAGARAKLGTALMNDGELAEAIEHLSAAVELEPDLGEAHCNLAVAYERSGRLEDALRHYRHAADLNPDDAGLHLNIAGLLDNVGRHELALDSHRRAEALDPHLANSSRAMDLLLRGNFAEGWRAYEWRGAREEFFARRGRPAKPEWNGEPIAGKRLLVHAEQGLGDSIQFVRYLPQLRALGAEVILECFEPLRRLLGGASTEAPLPDFDTWVALLSLPRIFGTTLETIPAEVPYLKPPRDSLQRWRDRLSGATFNVGVVWSGNPKHVKNASRSMPLAALEPLTRLEGIRLFSLQRGAASPASVVDLSPLLYDRAETAAAIDCLDLVVSVDTSVAHLAGALGKPVWILLSTEPDWRWLLDREDSPWYPTARLVRQRRPGDWDELIARVRTELARVRPAPAVRT